MALEAIEMKRKAVDVTVLENNLARRRSLLRRVEELRDRRSAAALSNAQEGTRHTSLLQTEVRVSMVCRAVGSKVCLI